MPATFDRELVRLLIEAGCRFVRAGKGSHAIWYSPITGATSPSRTASRALTRRTVC
jgi:hypothetical protein